MPPGITAALGGLVAGESEQRIAIGRAGLPVGRLGRQVERYNAKLRPLGYMFPQGPTTARQIYYR